MIKRNLGELRYPAFWFRPVQKEPFAARAFRSWLKPLHVLGVTKWPLKGDYDGGFIIETSGDVSEIKEISARFRNRYFHEIIAIESFYSGYYIWRYGLDGMVFTLEQTSHIEYAEALELIENSFALGHAEMGGAYNIPAINSRLRMSSNLPELFHAVREIVYDVDHTYDDIEFLYGPD